MKLKKPDGTPWNNGNLDLLPRPLERRQARQRLELAASPDSVLAALGAVERWLGDEDLETRYAASGDAEPYALWSTRRPGRSVFGDSSAPTRVFVTRHAPREGALHLVLIEPKLAMGLLRITVEARAEGSLLTLDLVYAAIHAEGNALFRSSTVDRMQTWLGAVGRRLDAASGAGAGARAQGAGQPVTTAGRRTVVEDMVVRADADEIFPYACPVAELEWIDEWQFDLLHSVSGRNELHNIFLEPASGAMVLRQLGAGTVWYTTRWEPDAREFHAVLLTGNLTVAQWELRIEDLGDGRCRMQVTLTYTGLSEAGDRILAEGDLEDRMRQMLRFVLTSARCYAETGKILRIGHHRKVSLALSLAGAALGRHLRRLHGRG